MQSRKKQPHNIKFSVILPVYNELENLPQLFEELLLVFKKVAGPYEIICINDGSTDHSPTFIEKFTQDHLEFKLINLRKNQGQSAALSAGFMNAKGEYVITMDADLQNDPSDIIKLIEYLPRFDMVNGWRTKRHDKWLTRISSRIANSTRNMLTRENIHDTGCSLKIMKKSYLDRIKMFKGMHRFLPTLLKLEGAKVIEVPVNHRPRTKGTSNYGVWNRAFSGFKDLLAVRWMQKRHIQLEIKEEKK
jgi:dolichol-phosphate mannosyltransferase